MLKANISLNQLKHVQAECLAVMDKNESISLHVSGKDNQGMSSIYHHDAESGRTEEVKGIRLDDFLKARFVERIDLIKIDIEGAEIFALRGMSDTLRNLRPALIIEVVDIDSKDGKEVFCHLAELNYLPYSLDKKGALTPFRKYETAEAYYNYVFLPTEKVS
jgi:FkbM family methyltransferase